LAGSQKVSGSSPLSSTFSSPRLTPISSDDRQVGRGGLPLILGIAEHGSLAGESLPTFEQLLRTLLMRLRAAYPNTPLVLLSPLTEGADQAAAEVHREQGGEVLQAPSSDCDARDAFTVHHCQLLIAVASETGNRSPLSQAGRWQLEGLPRELAPRRGVLDPPEIGPVARISARPGKRNSHKAKDEIEVLWPEILSIDRNRSQLEQAFRPFEELNRDLSRFGDGEKDAALSSSGGAWENAWPAALQLHTRFEVVDRLATRFQHRSMRSVALILLLAAVGALSLNLRIVLPSLATTLLWTYAIALGAAYGVYLWAKFGNFHNKYLDYRALAEGLRVQAFWTLGGVEACAADFYLQRQKGELAWIRQALRNWFLMDNHHQPGSPQQASESLSQGLEFVYRNWIKDQRLFFEQSAKRRDRTARGLGLTARTLFRIGLALAALNAIIAPHVALVVVAGMAPVGAALIHLYNRHRALAEDARRYSSMSLIWASAEAAFAKRLANGDLEECREIVRELGHETLAENGEWILLHRQRPLEVPTVK
jgi:hypothetical protein